MQHINYIRDFYNVGLTSKKKTLKNTLLVEIKKQAPLPRLR